MNPRDLRRSRTEPGSARALATGALALAAALGAVDACSPIELPVSSAGGGGSTSTPTSSSGSAGGGGAAPCSPGDGAGGSFGIVCATVVSKSVVSLVFTEPVAAPDAVDPSHFRLSGVQTQRQGKPDFQFCWEWCSTVDCSYDPYIFCSGHYDACPGPERHRFQYCTQSLGEIDQTRYDEVDPIAAVVPGSRPEELLLELTTPLGEYGDTKLPEKGDGFSDNRVCNGLYLHYTQAGPGGVADAAHEPLAPFAPTWVGVDGPTSHADGFLPEHPVPVSLGALAAFCAHSSCFDGEKNGTESDVDCGGSEGCGPCADAEACQTKSDCLPDWRCLHGLCAAPTCDDGVANQGESDVDCGGLSACPRCDDGKRCVGPEDCASATCLPTWLTSTALAAACATPTCQDSFQDGDEVGPDCGGSCGGCLGASCGTTADCGVGACVGGLCSPRLVLALSAGQTQSCAVLADGSVACWGDDAANALLDGATTPRLLPEPIPGLAAGPTAISVGLRSTNRPTPTCVITAAGGVSCWGDAFGPTPPPAQPVDVVGLPGPASAISTGGAAACAVVGGALLCWGDNTTGVLGDGTAQSRSTAAGVSGLGSGVGQVSVASDHACAAVSGGVQCWGNLAFVPVGQSTGVHASPIQVIPAGSGVTSVVAAAEHACALLAGGAVECWGFNDFGQLGDGTTTSHPHAPVAVTGLTNATAISATFEHTCALTATGGVICWGTNDHGQLGDGTTQGRRVPTPVNGLASGVVAISAGLLHTCALTATGRAFCWGQGYGLGAGTSIDTATPVEVIGL